MPIEVGRRTNATMVTFVLRVVTDPRTIRSAVGGLSPTSSIEE
jgi:hypothetical protein